MSVRLYTYKVVERVAATSLDNRSRQGVNYGRLQ